MSQGQFSLKTQSDMQAQLLLCSDFTVFLKQLQLTEHTDTLLLAHQCICYRRGIGLLSYKVTETKEV